MKDVSCVDHFSFVPNVPIVAIDLPIGARLHQFSGKMGSPGGQSQSHYNPQGRLNSPRPAKSDILTHHHKLLCKSPQEQLPDLGIACTYDQKYSRTGHNSEISWVLQQTFPGSKTQQLVETYSIPQYP